MGQGEVCASIHTAALDLEGSVREGGAESATALGLTNGSVAA
jgi:hypothetical protein